MGAHLERAVTWAQAVEHLLADRRRRVKLWDPAGLLVRESVLRPFLRPLLGHHPGQLLREHVLLSEVSGGDRGGCAWSPPGRG